MTKFQRTSSVHQVPVDFNNPLIVAARNALACVKGFENDSLIVTNNNDDHVVEFSGCTNQGDQITIRVVENGDFFYFRFDAGKGVIGVSLAVENDHKGLLRSAHIAQKLTSTPFPLA